MVQLTLSYGKILIGHESSTHLKDVFKTLERSGFEIWVASTVEKLVNMATQLLPHLIVLDNKIAGMDSHEVCRQLRAKPSTQNTPVLFMKSSIEPEHRDYGYELGTVDYITQPINQQEVLARVHSHLRTMRLAQLLDAQVELLQAEIEQRKAIENQLRESNLKLEQRVQNRTAQLSETNTLLREEIQHCRKIEEALFQEKELAQVTLESIGDAVMTTDILGKIKYMNPVAEQLTGWKNTQAKDQPISDVFTMINEVTGECIENPVEQVMQMNQRVNLASYAVLRSQGQIEYAIEGSMAPIHSRQEQVMGVVLVFRDVTASRQLVSQISWQANHDHLTGLLNRQAFEKKILEVISMTSNQNKQHALCFLDLDKFKVINDTCGHEAGDELLRQITTLMQTRVRSSDSLARLGGDEFGLLLYNCSQAKAKEIAETLRSLIEEFRFVWNDKIFSIGVSIGIAKIDENTQSLASILRDADAACYAAKSQGRNCVCLAETPKTQPTTKHQKDKQWIVEINQALQENRFCLYYQKIASIQDETKTQDHYEVLLRLIDDNSQVISPMTFIPIAERYGLMPAVDQWVIRNFLARYENYLQNSPEAACLHQIYTINLSGTSVSSNQFLSFLKTQLSQHQIPLHTLCFEITETAAIANLDQAVKLIKELKKLGCRFALDDFGSGMSSLTHLKYLPVDYLKIDGSFVKNIATTPVEYAMVESFNNIGHVMGIKTIAEFVENKAILKKLKAIGVDYAQGYTIAKPCPLFA